MPARPPRHRVSRADLGLVLLVLPVGALWVVLARWYSLLGHWSETHFAFEKLPGHSASPVLRGTLLAFLALALLYGAGYLLIARSERVSVVARLAVAALVVGPGIANVLVYPVGALDVFNYMVELKLTYHYDQNPYLVTFAAFRDDPFALPAFLIDVKLFYGPVWLLVSGLPALLVGFDDVIRLLLALKLFNLALLGLTGLAIHRYRGGGKPGWLAAYAFLANPLVLFEGVGNAHNDVLMALFLVMALLALRRRSSLSPALLALSALVKPFTAALAPLFLAAALRGRWGWQRLAGAASLTAAVAVLAAAPFWAGGAMLGGLKEGTVASQEMDHVSPLSLAQQYAAERRTVAFGPSSVLARGGRCPGEVADTEAGAESPFAGSPLARCERPAAAAAVADPKPRIRALAAGLFAVLALLVAWAVRRGRAPAAAALDTLLLFLLLLTNLYPWYLIPAVAILVLAPGRGRAGYLVAATLLGLAYYPAYVWGHFDSGWSKFEVHLFLALFLTVPMVVFLAAEAGRAVWRRLVGRAWVGRHAAGPALGAASD